MKQEILSVCISHFKHKVDSIMLEINLLLSSPTPSSNVSERVSAKIEELAIAESSLRHATSFLTQEMVSRLSEIEKIQTKSESDNKTKEEGGEA